ncbi:hypothetical protein NQ318_021400 [Aromia moschata]|uniref:Uncharacterized protein n=1 Tax=Aromia moschata TaxID=1265417 RepID=A0AAV8ZEZ8_9CUCU|nr:hypothetical protein NQ318_021400 [Aromia moschata]
MAHIFTKGQSPEYLLQTIARLRQALINDDDLENGPGENQFWVSDFTGAMLNPLMKFFNGFVKIPPGTPPLLFLNFDFFSN